MTDYDVDENGVIQSGYFKGKHTRPPSRVGGDREMIWHRPVPPEVTTETRHGDTVTRERHPAYGLMQVSRVTTHPGATLFDSDIKHTEVVRLTLKRAVRDRDLNRDWIYDTGPDLVEVDMSMAQWGALVSSFGSSGVPVTIRTTETDQNVDGLEFQPRLQNSMDEIKSAADKVFGRIDAAMAEWDALDPKAGVKERRAVISKIRNAVRNAESNMTFAATSLEEHAEKVVAKARADIEAMVYKHAERLGLDPADTLNTLALGGPADAPVAIEAPEVPDHDYVPNDDGHVRWAKCEACGRPESEHRA